jgi:hypothetical protein
MHYQGRPLVPCSSLTMLPLAPVVSQSDYDNDVLKITLADDSLADDSLSHPVDGQYRDFAQVPDLLGETMSIAHLAITYPSFPVKLHCMLAVLEEEGSTDIVGWEGKFLYAMCSARAWC